MILITITLTITITITLSFKRSLPVWEKFMLLGLVHSDITLLSQLMVPKHYLKTITASSDYRPHRKYLELFDCGTDTEVGRRFTRLWTVSASLTFTDSNALKFLLHLLSTLKKSQRHFPSVL